MDKSTDEEIEKKASTLHDSSRSIRNRFKDTHSTATVPHHSHPLIKKNVSSSIFSVFNRSNTRYMCDGCDKELKKVRWTCSKGCDFDLCEECLEKFGKGLLLDSMKTSTKHAHALRWLENLTGKQCDECHKTSTHKQIWNCSFGCDYYICDLCLSGKNTDSNKEPITDYSNFIPDQQTWSQLCHIPTDHVFTNTQVVKVIYSVEDDKIYFLKTVKWKYHYNFCCSILHYAKSLGYFNVAMYEMDNRPYNLGSLTHYLDHDIYTFDIWPGDNLKGERIKFLFEKIQKSVFFGDKLRFRPMSETHYSNIQNITIPQIDSSELMKGVKYQPLTIGKSYGTLQIFIGTASKYDFSKLNHNSIIICEEVPIDLPAINGLITFSLQTPLCHVALLCQNRHTPNMGLVDSDKKEELIKLEGKCVFLSVTRQGYTLEEVIDKSKAETWFSSRAVSSKERIKLKYSLEDTGILELLSFRSIESPGKLIGAKAKGLLDIATIPKLQNCGLSNIVTDNALVVPFYLYQEHIIKSNCVSLIEDLDKLDIEQVDEQKSKSIMDLIIKTPIQNMKMQTKLLSVLTSWKEQGVLDNASGVIFRSSTNVEDLPGFNGAGLYLSEPLSSQKCLDWESISDVIKRVWESVWSKRAIVERHLFGILQREVQAAVLIQPWYSSDKVIANGVGITVNPFRKDFPAHFLNVQVPGILVTNGDSGVTAEQILIYDEGKAVTEVITKSSEVEGSLITMKEINKLWPAMKILHTKYAKKPSNCVDVEFIILNNENRDVVLLQCRPLKMHFG